LTNGAIDFLKSSCINIIPIVTGNTISTYTNGVSLTNGSNADIGSNTIFNILNGVSLNASSASVHDNIFNQPGNVYHSATAVEFQNGSSGSIVNNTIFNQVHAKNGSILLNHRAWLKAELPSYCRAACCCILPNGRVDTSVIFACRCNTATNQSGSIQQSRTRRTRCSEESRVPITGVRCLNSAWQLDPPWAGLLVHTRLAGVLACWSTMPFEALGSSRHPPTAD